MRPIATACLAVFSLCQSALACSWIPIPFCQTSTERPNDVVLSGRIVGVDMDGIDVEVIDVLRGDEDRAIIRIWDGTDWDCNGLFSMAASDLGAVDDSIIVVLPVITTIENTWDVLGDYRRPDYFGYIPDLRVYNGLVTGYITGSASSPVYEMAYPDLVAAWSDGTVGCTGLSVRRLGQSLPFMAQVINDVLNVTVLKEGTVVSTITLHAMDGQIVVAEKSVPGTTRIDMSCLAAGMYHLVLAGPDGTWWYTRVMKV